MSAENQESEKLVPEWNSEFLDVSSIKRDRSCWDCHELTEFDGDVLWCTACPIVLHRECLSLQEIIENVSIWKCPECRKIDQCYNEEKSNAKIHQLLRCAFGWLVQNTETKFNIPDAYCGNPLLVNPITLVDIKKKIDKNQYQCTQSFYLDFKWLVHNCHILHNQSALFGAKEMLKQCVAQIWLLKTCNDCYLRDPRDLDDIALTCSKPHLLLWVKVGNYPYWPAKLRGINHDEQKPIEVAFFGESTSAQVLAQDCLLYSQSDPNKWSSKQKKSLTWKEFEDAIAHANDHIKQLKERFGAFVFAEKNTPFEIEHSDQYLKDMIPNYMNVNSEMIMPMSNEYDNNNEEIDVCGPIPDQSSLHADEPSMIYKHNSDDVEATVKMVRSLNERVKMLEEENEFLRKEYSMKKKLEQMVQQQGQRIECLENTLENFDKEELKKENDLLKKEIQRRDNIIASKDRDIVLRNIQISRNKEDYTRKLEIAKRALELNYNQNRDAMDAE